MSAPQELFFAGTALVVAGVCSFHDIRERRIPNRLTGPALLLALVLHTVLGGWSQLGASALGGLIAGGIFLVFFIAGGMGAGDVKLMAAVGAMVGLSSLRDVMLSTVLIGALFAILLALYRRRLGETLRNVGSLASHHQQNGLRHHPELNLQNDRTLRLPYAVPIAAGCLFTFCLRAWGASS